MTHYTALLDANVLYPAPLRDIFLQLAIEDLFRAKWTADIHREWIDALLEREPHRDRGKLERTRDLIDKATRDCLVTGYEELIPSIELPDPGDRHVLAAAIVGRCDVIVTQNLKDFPLNVLDRYGVEAQQPDDFLSNHLNLYPGPFCKAVRTVRARLQNPPYEASEYLNILIRQGLVVTVEELQQYSQLI